MISPVFSLILSLLLVSLATSSAIEKGTSFLKADNETVAEPNACWCYPEATFDYDTSGCTVTINGKISTCCEHDHPTSYAYMIRWGDGKNSNKQEGKCFKDFSVSHTYPKGKHELTVTYQALSFGRQWCGELKHHKVSC
ncbi:uncharacterized protein LOC134180301 [Corticium candelabrum]|uniref:uncharacterized protein LOC134180301 n=1 Tax=Corticium candelabrum TaxID=121492 RepID=UPI002E26929E|nr:uncharacterized protein LOC134180301 [Corticium candelabrum]